MFAQRQIFRSAPRLAAQLRANGQRRLMSSHPNPSSVESSTENAFVRERRAVKEHAAATTGTSSLQHDAQFRNANC